MPQGTVNPERTPEELARLAQAGSSQEFDALARLFTPRLVRYLRRLTRRREDAEDIAQETLLRAVRNIDRYDPNRPFGAWLFTIATRLASNHARRKPTVTLDAEPASNESTPHETLETKQEAQNIWARAQRILPARQHMALWLRYAEELDTHDIAEVLGLTRLHTRVLLHRARQAILNDCRMNQR